MTPLARPLAVLAVTSLVAVTVPTVVPSPAAATTSTSCHRTRAHYPDLRPGDRSAGVRTLQCALDDLGFRVAIDGYYGPQTRAAVRHIEGGFEGERPEPGLVDAGFWTLLYGRQLPDHKLARGDHGHAVTVLQRSLRAAGADLEVDGYFGPQTAGVVRRYQRTNDYRPTGRVNRDVVFMLAMGGTF